MTKFIAFCGLNCETCDARLATINNDNELRIKTAKLWSELNNADITPEMINCSGCRIDGVKTPYCESLCPIRQCALAKNVEICEECADVKSCEKVRAIVEYNDKVR